MMMLTIQKNEVDKTQKMREFLCYQFPQQAVKLLDLDREWKHGWSIELKPLKTKRSRPQENYYRKWCNGFAKFCGLTPDEMHDELLCQCYGSEEVETKFGVVRRPVKRSNDATRGDYSDLIETLCRVAAEMGYDVPPPEITE
jgi:hypothetical protein